MLTLTGQYTLAATDATTLTGDLPQAPIAYTTASDAPTVTSGTDVDVNFGGSTWTGMSYTPMTATLPITITPPTIGCVATSYTVSISGGAPLSDGTTTIGNDAIRIASVTEPGQVAWGTPVEPDGTLASPQPVFTTQPTGAAGEQATVYVDLSLIPPPDASPGAYAGSITITITPSP